MLADLRKGLEDGRQPFVVFSGGKIEFRLDKHANMQFPIGKASFTADQLNDNFAAVIDEINRMKPSAAKGRYIKKATLSSTMGPGIPIDPAKSEDDDF